MQPPIAPISYQPGSSGSFQAVIGGHVSHAERGHKLACHMWLESFGSLLARPTRINEFGDHARDEKIKMDELV